MNYLTESVRLLGQVASILIGEGFKDPRLRTLEAYPYLATYYF